jgi:hypothetical protein
VGSTTATAADLAGSGPLTAAGIIGPSGDADVFRVTSGAGTLSVGAGVADLGPDLDILLELLDGSGTLIASDNLPDVLTAAVSMDVPQGTYYLRVSGTGKGSPLQTGGYSAYGCVGTYSFYLTVPAPDGNPSPVASMVASKTSGDSPLR